MQQDAYKAVASQQYINIYAHQTGVIGSQDYGLRTTSDDPNRRFRAGANLSRQHLKEK